MHIKKRMEEKLQSMRPKKKKTFWEREIKPLWGETHNSDDEEDEDDILLRQKEARKAMRSQARESKAILDAKFAAAEKGERLAI